MKKTTAKKKEKKMTDRDAIIILVEIVNNLNERTHRLEELVHALMH